MRNIIILVTILILIQTSQTIYLHNQNVIEQKIYPPMQQQIINALKLYRNDYIIQKQINQIVEKQSHIFEKYTCPNAKNYNYLVINDKQIQQKKQIVITCNVHARQLLVTEVCLDFVKKMSQVLENKQIHKQPSKNTQFDLKQISSLLNSARITMFYRANSQRDKVIQGPNYCIRKDENNVDINRNFVTNFNFHNLTQDKQQYPGQKPLSQPFAACVDDYLQTVNQTHKINIFIDIHTGQFSLFDSFSSESKKGFQTKPILYKLKKKYCPQCRINSLGGLQEDQWSDGQMFTDIKKRYNADHSVLLEIYGGYNGKLDNNLNCVAIFNPLTSKQLNYYKQLWKNGLMYFLKQSMKKLQ